MKCYVIMLAKTFPATHPRAGQPTRFDEKILDGIKKVEMGEEPSTWKIHTIRQNYILWRERMAEVAVGRAFLSLRQWSGRPYHSDQVELFKLTHENGVGLQHLIIFEDEFFFETEGDSRAILAFGNNEKLADNDGLSQNDFDGWFKKKDRGQSMALIHFTKFRYTK